MPYVDQALWMQDGIAPTPWYLSPDLVIPNDEAQAGANPVQARIRMHPTFDFNGTRARYQVFCSEPSMAIPSNGAYNALIHDSATLLVGDPLLPKLGKTALKTAGNAGTAYNFTWTLGPGAIGSIPALTIGHKCLIARLWSAADPAPTAFNVFAEEHEVQRNIQIVASSMKAKSEGAAGAGMPPAGMREGKPLGGGRERLWEFRVNTTAVGRRVEKALWRATWLNRRPRGELKRVVAILKRRPGFAGLAEAPLPRFGLRVDIPKEQLPSIDQDPYVPEVLHVDDATGVERGDPTYGVVVALLPRIVARVGVTADLRTTPVGHAHVIALEQLGPRGRIDGGTLVVFHRVV
jgi:hypothetical protein